MKSPSYLKKGDTIGLIATARKISEEELQPAIKVIKQWGLKYEFSKHLFKEENQFSGSDKERAEDFMQMYCKPNIKAILCSRGGYGTAKIIPHLELSELQQHSKWLIGYSDVTVLHSFFNTQLKTQSIHASMPINFSQYQTEDKSLSSLKSSLFGEKISYQIAAHELNRTGKCEAEIVGGNLSVLFSLRATPFDLNLKGKILLIEDLDEYLYHIDRMMTNFYLSGALKDLAGLIIGGMNDMNDNAIPFGKTAYQIIHEHVKAYNYPVAFGFPSGHIQENYALKLGAKVQFEVKENESKLLFL